MKVILCLVLVLYGVQSKGIGLRIQSDCGSILREVTSGPGLPAGWTILCYITPNDTEHVNKTCRQLPQDLPGVGNSTDLLAMGGNFGCWRTTMHPEDDNDILIACQDNYQHDTKLEGCGVCQGLVACIKYPVVSPPTPTTSTLRSTHEGATVTTTEALGTTVLSTDVDVTTPIPATTTPPSTPPSTPPVTPPPGTINCGSILHYLPDDPRLVPSWTALCYISLDDDPHLSTPCRDLLQNIPGVGSGEDLLLQGGDFGCHRTTIYPPTDDENIGLACKEGYQHDVSLAECQICGGMSVCIRYPPRSNMK